MGLLEISWVTWQVCYFPYLCHSRWLPAWRYQHPGTSRPTWPTPPSLWGWDGPQSAGTARENYYGVIDMLHKCKNAPVSYRTMRHSVTEMCTCVHISVTKWCIVGYLSNALWDLWDGSSLLLPDAKVEVLIYHTNYQWLCARVQYLHWVRKRDTAVLHWNIDIKWSQCSNYNSMLTSPSD